MSRNDSPKETETTLRQGFNLQRRNVVNLQSQLLEYCGLPSLNEHFQRPRKSVQTSKNFGIIRQVGITIQEIYSLPQYKIRSDELPIFSCYFDRLDDGSSSKELFRKQ